MVIQLSFRRPRLSFALLPLVIWACSSGGSGGGSMPNDDSQQHIDSKGGGGSSSTSTAGKGGTAPSASAGEGGKDAPEESGDAGSPGKEEPTPAEDGGTGPGPDEPSMGGGAGAPDEPAGPSEAYLRGEALAKQNDCVMCHQENYAGFTVFPNITPDKETGIGNWTDEQIIAAIRDGIDTDGKALCPTMQRYSLTEDQAADMVAFLRGLPSVSNRITSMCPGHGT